MKLAIMQPYFVPYIGYWQLMNAVDQFVVYDDVNFINRGWVNRNRILANGHPKYFNMPLLGASQNKLIYEIEVNPDLSLIEKNIRRLENAYRKAPYSCDVITLLKEILKCKERKTSDYLVKSFEVICGYLDITTKLVYSSSLKKDCGLKGKDKILSICRLLGAEEYFNPIGGKDLYSFQEFRRKGIQLKFLKSDDIVYRQFTDEFYANLSIIDVMMFNSREQIKELLHMFTLLTEQGDD